MEKHRKVLVILVAIPLVLIQFAPYAVASAWVYMVGTLEAAKREGVYATPVDAMQARVRMGAVSGLRRARDSRAEGGHSATPPRGGTALVSGNLRSPCSLSLRSAYVQGTLFIPPSMLSACPVIERLRMSVATKLATSSPV